MFLGLKGRIFLAQGNALGREGAATHGILWAADTAVLSC
jgi:hypothetical protein